MSSRGEDFYSLGHKQIVLEGNRTSTLRLKKVSEYVSEPVLDVGCGLGVVWEELFREDIGSEGTDINKESINFCKKKFGKENFFVHDFLKGATEKKYKTIICFEVIEHIFYYEKFLKSLVDSLAVGGRLIISTPNVFGLASWLKLVFRDSSHLFSAPDHVVIFDYPALESVLFGAGLTIVKRVGFSLSGCPLRPEWQGNILIVAEKRGGAKQ